MNKLSFENFYKLREMAVANFGKYGPKEDAPATHINDIDRGYVKWMLDKVKEGKTSFSFLADDGSGQLNKKQVEDALKIRLSGQKIAPTSVRRPIQPLIQQEEPEFGVRQPARQPISGQQEEPEKQEPEATATPGSIQSFDPTKYRIKPEWITEHQKEVRDAFDKSSAHIIMPALAGSGKTTMLKDLASNAKPGEKWLYLVFNKKNQLESQKAFPPGVEVFTSHSFLENKLFSLNPNKIPKTEVFNKDKHLSLIHI